MYQSVAASGDGDNPNNYDWGRMTTPPNTIESQHEGDEYIKWGEWDSQRLPVYKYPETMEDMKGYITETVGYEDPDDEEMLDGKNYRESGERRMLAGKIDLDGQLKLNTKDFGTMDKKAKLERAESIGNDIRGKFQGEDSIADLEFTSKTTADEVKKAAQRTPKTKDEFASLYWFLEDASENFDGGGPIDTLAEEAMERLEKEYPLWYMQTQD